MLLRCCNILLSCATVPAGHIVFSPMALHGVVLCVLSDAPSLQAQSSASKGSTNCSGIAPQGPSSLSGLRRIASQRERTESTPEGGIP